MAAGDKAAKILCFRDRGLREGLSGPEFRLAFAADLDAARTLLADAAREGDPFALFVGPGDACEVLEPLAAEAADLHFLVETPPGGCELPAPLTHERALCLEGPVPAPVRRSVALHLAARWSGLKQRREAERGLLADSPDEHGLDADRRRLETIYHIVEKLHAESTQREAFLTALTETADFLGATTASLMLLEEGSQVYVREALGPNRDRILGRRFPLEESRIARHAIEAGAPLLITDMRGDGQFGESPEEKRFRSRSVLCVPVISKGRTVAVLNFGGGAQDVTFTERDREFMVALARQVAAALEKNTLLDQLRTTVSGSIRALAHAIEAKDPYTRGHSDRVTRYSTLTAVEMGLPEADVELLKQAAILHDIGKIGIPGDVLNKQGRLDNLEFRVIKRHPEIGIDIVRQIGAMDQTLPIIHAHHEKLDGSGYPTGLKGDEIPLGARIIAVADAYDAMTSDRPYRAGMSVADASAEILRCIGTQFDPAVAAAFLRNIGEWSRQAATEELFFTMV